MLPLFSNDLSDVLIITLSIKMGRRLHEAICTVVQCFLEEFFDSAGYLKVFFAVASGRFVDVNWWIPFHCRVPCSTVVDISLRRQLFVILGLHFRTCRVPPVYQLRVRLVCFYILVPLLAEAKFRGLFPWNRSGHFVVSRVLTSQQWFTIIFKRQSWIDGFLWRKSSTVLHLSHCFIRFTPKNS